MSDEVTCKHCGHDWDRHSVDQIRGSCDDCGCRWAKRKPPEPPPPPPDPRVEAVLAAIFDELDRQNETDEIGGSGYWDREWGCVDGEPNWSKVAAAAVDAVLEATTPDEVWEWKNQ